MHYFYWYHSAIFKTFIWVSSITENAFRANWANSSRRCWFRCCKNVVFNVNILFTQASPRTHFKEDMGFFEKSAPHSRAGNFNQRLWGSESCFKEHRIWISSPLFIRKKLWIRNDCIRLIIDKCKVTDNSTYQILHKGSFNLHTRLHNGKMSNEGQPPKKSFLGQRKRAQWKQLSLKP